MKTIKYFVILHFSLGIVKENFAQINVHVGVGRPRYYRPPVKIITPYRHSRTVVVARPSYNRNNYYQSTSFRGNSYYNKPVVVNRYYYGGGYHPYPSYYRPLLL